MLLVPLQIQHVVREGMISNNIKPRYIFLATTALKPPQKPVFLHIAAWIRPIKQYNTMLKLQ